MSQILIIILVEVYPNFDTIEGLWIFRRDESKAVDVVWMIKILSDKIKDKICINLVLVFLALIDSKYKSTSLLVLRILPPGLNPFLKILNRVYFSPLLIHLVSESTETYVNCLLLFCSRKLSRLFSLQWLHTYARSTGLRILYTSWKF